MISRKPLIVVIAVGLLLLATMPHQVSADITGNRYNFSAIFFEQSYKVDNNIVLDETIQGSFRLIVFNITPSDLYEYTFTGMNYFFSVPFEDELNGSVDFQDNKVYFDLDTTDIDADNFTESYDFDVFPSFSGSSPGRMFFVNPVWSTHTADWNTALDDLESHHSITSVTESANEGRFSLRVVMNNEINHPIYNNMNGTVTISFNAQYDSDGVLSSWSLEHVTSSRNENHTIVYTQGQRFTRGTGFGGTASSIPAVLALVGAAGIGCLIIGIVIGKKY